MVELGLLGKNISYSLSPILHSYFFELVSIKGEYKIFDASVEKNEISYIQKLLEAVKNKELLGFNITIPYKETIIEHLDEIDETAKEIGAVNTVVLENGQLKGYNTDYLGIIETLKKMKIDIKGKNVYILGTGGSAKAAAIAVKTLGGMAKMVSRNPEKFKKLKEGYAEIVGYDKLEKIRKEILLINTTPLGNSNNLGISPIGEKYARKFENIFDLNYNPLKSKLMEFGKKSENGLYMLVVQGICSEIIWNRNLLKLEEMRDKKIIEKIYEKLKKEL